MAHSTAAHVAEIERALSGFGTERDSIVLESWQRCVSDYGLDPARPGEAYIVPDSQLREHRQESERLISIARSGVENLFRQVAGQNYVLLLCDPYGVTVDYFGDPIFEEELRTAGLYLGAEWSEERAGTCGVGACIRTGQALTIHQTDHFDMTHTPLSCTAAPIYDARGTLTAVLDISLLRSPQPKISQKLALHLVTAAVRRIELANLMESMRKQWVVRLSQSPDFLDVDPDAAIALDGSGNILGMTHSAARILADAKGEDWRASTSLVGRPVSEYLNLCVDDLPSLTRSRPSEERVVHLSDGAALFAHAIEPPKLSPRGAPATDLIPRPLLALSGEDEAMRTMQRRAAKLARTTIPIFIFGETGTGKECLARALHACRDENSPFIAINCAAIPESLMEGELFGHEPGAYTGALKSGRKGLIEAADGGILFLDEIGDMPLALQARLLRVISEGEVTRLGGRTARRINVQFISASHRNLKELVQQGAFRTDLYYRLAAAQLALPPLRRRTDFEWLMDLLLRDASRGADTPPRLSPEARLALIRHDWPGNIRELKNVLEVASALSDGRQLLAADFPDLAPGTVASPAPTLRSKRESEVDSLAILLAENDGNVSAVARALGVDRTTVHRRMKKFGLSRPH